MDEEAIFLAALAKSSLSERSAYLDEVCADNTQLRASVEALLRAHEAAGSFLEIPVLGMPNPGEFNAEGVRADATLPKDDKLAGSSVLVAEVVSEEAGSDRDDRPLDFLSPADRPELLGKLGHYDIIEVIGRGGMGLVLKGHDAKLNRVVAIKVLAPELASNVMARRRFLREAQAAAAVSHDHVITTHAIDEFQGHPYIVMEYVAGQSLQDRIDRGGPLDVKCILRIARQAALGLAAAHDQGLIHRDVKPANILLENGIERVKLSDFGLARAIDDVSTTRTGTVAGTPEFMSPEQAQGQRVDHRSDLFSVGCVMYAMCTGRSPFRADSTVAVLRRVCDEEPRAIERINPDIPPWLVAIISRLLAKNPDDRFQSADEVAELLGKCLAYVHDPTREFDTAWANSFRGGSTRPDRAGADGTDTADAIDDSAALAPNRLGGRTLRHRRRLFVAATVAAILCLAVGITDATGVADLRGFLGTVLRIGTPQGTLLVEVDDPAVGVTIDGEDISITGAGPREVRLKPGAYRLRAEKQGELIAQELVTITRDGKKVVRIGFEPASDQSPVDHEQASVEAVPAELFVEVTRLAGDRGVQHAACFAPSDEMILSRAQGGGDVRILQVADGTQLQRFRGVFGAAVFTADGHKVVTGSHHSTDVPNELVVWDVATGQPLQTLSGATGAFLDIAVSPSGRVVVSGHGQWWGDYEDRDHAIRIWDIEDGHLLHRIEGHTNQVTAVAIAPDGKTFVSGSRDGTVRLWDLETGEEIHRFVGIGTEVFSIAISPDGNHVLAGFGPDVETGIHERMIDDPAHCLVMMWEMETGTEVRRFVGHRGCIRDVAFSPDGKLVVSASGEAHVGTPLPDGGSKKTRDTTVRLWDAATGRQLASIEHRTSPASARFSANGHYLLTAEWQLVHLWRLPDSLLRGAGDQVARTDLRASLLVSSNRGGAFDIHRIDARHGEPGSPEGTWVNLTNHPAEDTGPACSPDGTKIAFCSSRSGNLDIWLMNSDGSGLRQLTDYPGIDRTPCWSPDGQRIAFVRHISPDNWEIFAMDADGSNEVNLTKHPAKQADPAWSPDGKSIAFSFDGDGTHLYLMDADGSQPRMLSGRKGMFTYPDWSPDGKRILFSAWADDVGGDVELFVINADGSDERQLTRLGGLNTFAAWSPDGRHIALQHRHPNIPGHAATVYVIRDDGSEPMPLSGAEAHIGFGGGRPRWLPTPGS